MTVRWSRQAAEDIQSLHTYLNERNPSAATRISETIASTVNRLLSENFMLGHPGRVPGTRELVIPQTQYIVPYRIRFGHVQILRVYHHSQPWPEQL
jgi:toxin ParE1/3/4